MSGLLPVGEALERLLEGAEPSGAETVPLADAAGRVLAEPLKALRTQPPFPSSAMDGYAVRAEDVAQVPARLVVTGMAAAGKLFPGSVGKGEAVRIFTGAPVPEGADTIAIQENVRKLGGDAIEVFETVAANRHIRAVGLDFAEGQRLLEKGRVLDAAALSLAAAANHPAVPVVKKPLVAIIATGDELLPPGSTPGPDQIIASNAYGVAAIAKKAGADVLDLGIAPDKVEAISELVSQALDAKADVIVTLGGASVGDHDLAQEALTGLGMELGFWKIAMRPGKPLMSGGWAKPAASAFPAIRWRASSARISSSSRCWRGWVDGRMKIMSSTPCSARRWRRTTRVRTMCAARSRARRTVSSQRLSPIQDSSMLKLLADAGGLIIREPFAPAAKAGDRCRVLLLR